MFQVPHGVVICFALNMKEKRPRRDFIEYNGEK